MAKREPRENIQRVCNEDVHFLKGLVATELIGKLVKSQFPADQPGPDGELMWVRVTGVHATRKLSGWLDNEPTACSYLYHGIEVAIDPATIIEIYNERSN